MRAARIVPGCHVSLTVNFILAFWLTPDADAGSGQWRRWWWDLVALAVPRALALDGQRGRQPLCALHRDHLPWPLNLWRCLVLYLLSHVTEGRFEYFGICSGGQHLAVGTILLVISFGTAASSWRWIEKPALTSRWANRR